LLILYISILQLHARHFSSSNEVVNFLGSRLAPSC
jgi:hypothetical protein